MKQSEAEASVTPLMLKVHGAKVRLGRSGTPLTESGHMLLFDSARRELLLNGSIARAFDPQERCDLHVVQVESTAHITLIVLLVVLGVPAILSDYPLFGSLVGAVGISWWLMTAIHHTHWGLHLATPNGEPVVRFSFHNIAEERLFSERLRAFAEEIRRH